MNCPKCGTLIPQGAAFCPVCNEPVSAYVQPGYMPGYAQGMPQGYPQPGPGAPMQPPAGGAQTMPPPVSGAQGMPPSAAQQPYMGAQQQPYPQQQSLYRQSYAQYQQGTYPPGFQQPYSYGQPTTRDANPLLTALSALPRTFLDSFSQPQEVLRGMLEKKDRLTGPIVAALTLLLTFLCGMVVMRSFVGVLLSAISTLTGVSLASDAASMNQGVSYIAGRIAPSVGGAAVLCQLIGMAVPALVFLVYLCGVAKVHFSWELLLGFVGVTTLPTAAVALLAMVLSLLSPWLALLAALCGMAVSYTQACGLLSAVTGRPDAQLLPVKMLLVALALALTLIVGGLVGGLLMRGVTQRVMVLLNSVGSLI